MYHFKKLLFKDFAKEGQYKSHITVKKGCLNEHLRSASPSGLTSFVRPHNRVTDFTDVIHFAFVVFFNLDFCREVVDALRLNILDLVVVVTVSISTLQTYVLPKNLLT